MKHTDFARIADILAKKHRIKLHKDKMWAADIKTRDVYYNGQDIYSLEEDQILGLLLHEIAHIHYTTESGPYKKNKELMQSAMNLIEDIAIEEIIGGDYPNAKEILDTTRDEVLTKLMRILPTLKDTPEQEKAMLYGSARFHGRGYDNPVTPYEQMGQAISEYMEMHRTDILERKQTSDLVPIAEHIVDMLTNGVSKQERQANGNPQGDAVPGMGDLTDKQKQQYAQPGHGQGKGRTDQGIQQQIKAQIIKAMKEDNGGDSWSSEEFRIKPELGFVDEIGDQSMLVGKKVRTTLKRNQAMEYAGRFRTGKLKAKAIKRLIVNRDQRPFQRRIVKSNQSYAFAIASDVSGSMYGYGSNEAEKNTASKAMTGMWMVAEALRMAKVPRSLIVFGTQAVVMSKMGTQKVNWNDISREDKVEMAGGGTSIARAMDACIQQLNGVRAERKIMIILTDGGDSADAVRESYKRAQQAGIECIGIELGGGALKQVFKSKESVVLGHNEQNRIGDAFIKILASTVKMDSGTIQ